jgi:hypothetical protein
MGVALSSQCYIEMRADPALLAGLQGPGSSVEAAAGDTAHWLPVGALLSTEQQREWRFLLECWCLYNDMKMLPCQRPAPVLACQDPAFKGSGVRGVAVALKPAQILDFIEWAREVPRHENHREALATVHLDRLRAYLADDVSASTEIRIIAADA